MRNRTVTLSEIYNAVSLVKGTHNTSLDYVHTYASSEGAATDERTVRMYLSIADVDRHNGETITVLQGDDKVYSVKREACTNSLKGPHWITIPFGRVYSALRSLVGYESIGIERLRVDYISEQDTSNRFEVVCEYYRGPLKYKLTVGLDHEGKVIDAATEKVEA